MARYSDEELATILERELALSLGAPDTEIAAVRVRNLQYYNAEPVGELAAPDLEDRSSITASDVADTVEWMLPSLVRQFAASPEAMECEAKRPQFMEQSKLASEYLQHWFWKRNHGFNVLYQWFKDALVQVVGFVKVHTEDVKDESEDEYTGLLPEQVQDLLSEEGVSVLNKAERQTSQGTLYDLRIKRVTQRREFCILSVPPEEMRVHPRARYGDEPLFIAQVYQRTRAELEAEGYDLTDVSSAATNWDQQTIARNTNQDWVQTEDEGELEPYEVKECYIRLDQDKDGVPELLFVKKIGDKIFEQEPVDDHPFVWFCPNPMPHVFFGTCPASQAIEPQRLRTSLIRSVADNVYMSVNKMIGAVEGQVELDDLLNRRPGGIVRMKSKDALMPLDQTGLDQSAWSMVEWAEQWRETRTGFTRYSQGLSPDALNPTATGVNIITEKADQRVELIARVAAESVRRMFEKVLAQMGKYQDSAAEVQIGGQFVAIDPREWRDAFNVHVNVGLGTGNKDKVAQVMGTVFQMQQPMIQAGALPMQAAVLAARRFADAAGISGAEELFPDAQQPPPGPPLPLLVEQAKGQVAAQLEQIRSQTKIAETQAQLQLQATNDARDAERAQMEAQLRAQLEAQKFEFDARIAAQKDETERWKAQLQAETQILLKQMEQGFAKEQAQSQAEGASQESATVVQAIQGLQELLAAPRVLVRDKMGKATHSEIRKPGAANG